MIIQYLRDKNGAPKGLVMAVNINNECVIGYSLCRKGDTFNKEYGKKIAIGRAAIDRRKEDGSIDPYILPFTLNPIYEQVIDRARKYFKNCKFLYNVIPGERHV